MDSINRLGYPLAYKVVQSASLAGNSPQTHTVQTAVRALEGMQKEAIVTDESTGTSWRLVSDEGPYLNGTDLAPFPLAFFTTGMALSFTKAFLQHAQQQNIQIENYQLTQDNRYTMEGSAIRGDMIGGALPVEMLVEVDSDACPKQIQDIVNAAKKASPAQAMLQQVLTNTFSLQHNGMDTAVTNDLPHDLVSQFIKIPPLPENRYAKDIITKQKTAETLFGVDGGAGSSLQATQKRTLHVRGICTLRPDGLKQVDVQLFKPIGSTFRFLGDDSYKEFAPSSLVYLSAGVGFCFMTQIGRYAHITKQKLHIYSILQETKFSTGTEKNAEAFPVNTHVYLESDESDEIAQKTVEMSERTCFLHAAMRQATTTNITIRLNEKSIATEQGG